MGLGGLLGGALTGIGRGIEMQAVAQQKEAEDTRRDDALMRRQIALAKYESDLQAARDKTLHGYKMSEAAAELGIRGELAAAADERDQKQWTERNQTEFKQALTKLEKEQKFTLSRDATNAARDAAIQAQRDGDLIDHWETDAESGELVGFTKTGKSYRSPLKPLHQRGGSGGILDDYEESGGSSGGKPSSAPRAPAELKSGSQQTITKQDRLNAINAAIAKGSNGDPRYKGLSGTQIAAKVDAMIANQGITVK